MIGMAVVLCGTSAITFSYASQGARFDLADHPPQIARQFEQDSQNPIDGFGQNNQNNNQSENQPPQGDNQSGQQNQQPPQSGQNGQSGEQNEQPQAPPSDNSSNQQDDGKQSENSDEKANRNTALSSESSVESSAQTTGNMPQMQRRGTSAISVICYLFFAIQIMILLLIFVYLALSKFNRISFNEVAQKLGSKNKQK